VASDDVKTRTRPDRSRRGASLRLIVFTDQGPSQRDLEPGARLLIGRGEDCDVCLPDHSVSRHHAILCGGPPPTIQDLASTNGTIVGSARLDPKVETPIDPLVLVQLGDALLVVREAMEVEQLPVRPAHDLLPRDPSMARMEELIELVSGTTVPVILMGETGAGKGVVAETIHRRSARAAAAFVRVNCAALAEGLFESELFGHEKGAFTGAVHSKPGLLEAAHGGTILLDEVGDMPASIQAKLLHAVEHGEVLRVGSIKPKPVDVRFISATNHDLPKLVEEGRFRRDLFFRINGATILVPPLRDRRSEIPQLARSFATEASTRLHCAQVTISDAALALLSAYDWPGNVRELRNAMVRAVLFARGGCIGVEHFELASPRASDHTLESSALRSQVRELEKSRIVDALERCNHNQVATAKALGIARGTLRSRMRELGLLPAPKPR
jgi:transcriptional regulator with PAS, ATPase and Fis domain